MFGLRRPETNSSKVSNGDVAWNGWTPSLLELINRRQSLDFEVLSMSITRSFDAARFADAVHLDELDVQSRREMPGLADEPPSRFQDRTPYPEIEANLQARAVHGEIPCEIEVRQAPKKYPLAYVAEKGLVGHITIDATDPTGSRTKGKEWKKPFLSLHINEDIDCQLLDALRNSFRAAKSKDAKPRLRVFLAEKFDASVSSLLDEKAATTIGVKQVVVWEIWG
jgi:hypothetical protein